MSSSYISIGVSFHREDDADLTEWLASLPASKRSAAIRATLRIGLRAQGNLPTDYKRGRNSSGPDMLEVKDMLRTVMGMIENLTGQEFILAERDDQGNLQPRDLGFSAEAQESLASRLFGDDEDE